MYGIRWMHQTGVENEDVLRLCATLVSVVYYGGVGGGGVTSLGWKASR
jgi:hypothetical protein